MGRVKIAIISPEVFSYGAMLIGGILKKEEHQINLFNNLRPQNVMDMDIIGLSLTSILHLLNARELVSKLKAGPKPIIIVGGSISQISELVFRILPEIDVVVVGEGEETAPELVEALKLKRNLEEVDGIAFKHDNEMVKTSPRKPVSLAGRVLPEIPPDIGRQNIRGANVYVETHRGCLGNCGFCQVPCLFGREVRSRPVNDIVVEVKAFTKAGARKIALFGGTSNQYGCKGSKLKDEAFITMLREVGRITGPHNLSVPDLRVDMVNEAVLKAIRKYTIGFVIFGIESGSNKILAKMRKGITVDKIMEGVKRAREGMLEVAGSFIVGYPGETDEDYAETKELVEELMLDDYSVSIADPIPGTLLAEEAVQLPREENPVFVKDSSKLGVLHRVTVAEARAFDLMLTASMVRSRPLPITNELYNTFLREAKKQGEEIRLVTNILKEFYGYQLGIHNPFYHLLIFLSWYIMIEIHVNGEKLKVNENLTILDAINVVGAPYAKDCKIIAMKRGEELISEPHLMTKDFFIETSKGTFSIRVADSLLPLWLKHYQDFQGVEFGWNTRNAVTFGSIDLTNLGLKATREKVKYHRWDVFLSFGGFDPALTYICFSRADHEGVYGAPKENWGIIGRVISGGHVILDLERGDSILRIYASTIESRKALILRPEEIGEKAVEDDMRILTYVEAALHEEASNCAEHFLATVEDDFFKVSRASSMFVCNEKFVGIPSLKENTVYRPKGAITVRNAGGKVGAVYIYRNDAPFTSSHSLVGKIVRGIELVEHANPDDKILMKTIPERLMVVGMSQGQAASYLSQRRIRHIRVGDENDQAMIIEQRPKLTMEVKRQGSIVTLGVDPKFINHINVWGEKSPRSALHFRMVADMIYSPIGKLHVLANTEEALILSGPEDIKTIKSIPVETNPSDMVEEGMIGVTNSRKKLSGLIGIRLKASKTYGPTGEPFEATNIVGRTTENLDLLKNKNAGDTIYLREEKCE